MSNEDNRLVNLWRCMQPCLDHCIISKYEDTVDCFYNKLMYSFKDILSKCHCMIERCMKRGVAKVPSDCVNAISMGIESNGWQDNLVWRFTHVMFIVAAREMNSVPSAPPPKNDTSHSGSFTFHIHHAPAEAKDEGILHELLKFLRNAHNKDGSDVQPEDVKLLRVLKNTGKDNKSEDDVQRQIEKLHSKHDELTKKYNELHKKVHGVDGDSTQYYFRVPNFPPGNPIYWNTLKPDPVDLYGN